jgi:hypothetical protein
MKYKLAISTSIFLVLSPVSSYAQLTGDPDTAVQAPGNRVELSRPSTTVRYEKTEAQIESEVVRYLAVQLTGNDAITRDLMTFLDVDSQDIEKIHQILQPIEDHFLQLEMQRMRSLCASWNSEASNAAVEAKLDASLNAYEAELLAQRGDPISLYSDAISQIGKVLGPSNQEAWGEYLAMQRTLMARMNTTYFNQNVFASIDPVASISANCKGI